MRQVSISDAIDRFRRAAIEKGNYASSTDEDHALRQAMSESWRDLESHGAVGREAFGALMADESRHVRAWAAAQLLSFGDERAVVVLEADASTGGVSGLGSAMVLREWKAGRLKPPL